MNYQSVITLNTKSRTELTWWMENLRFCNSQIFSQLNPQMVVQEDVSLTGWGVVCNGDQTSGQWPEEVRTLHMNVLELLAIKLTLFSFAKWKLTMRTIHFQIGKKATLPCFQIDNKAVLSYLLKLGRTKNKYIKQRKFRKEIWHYLLNHNIFTTTEYPSSILNTVTDRESREKPGSSEWLIYPKVSQAVSQLPGSLTIDLFASLFACLCHQLPQYIAWHLYSYSEGMEAMIQNWNKGLPYAFLPFSMILRVLLKTEQKCVRLLTLITLVWSAQPWYPELLNLSVKEPMLLPQGKEIL